ncbi:hypothetical protein GJ496_005600 [Pomphorhynchus laevis]|nr:hypothetical protein GJ496_005600 [Pomphorhynchus laevis]
MKPIEDSANTVSGIKYSRRTVRCFFQIGIKETNKRAYIRVDSLNKIAQSWEHPISSVVRVHKNFVTNGMLTLVLNDGTELSLTEAETSNLNVVVELLSQYRQNSCQNLNLPIIKPVSSVECDEQQITKLKLVDFCKNINMTRNLVNVEIHNCPTLKSLPVNLIDFVNLRVLSCTSTGLLIAPPTMPPMLQVLDLSNNNLSDNDFPALVSLNKLINVNLSYNHFSRMPQSLAILGSSSVGDGGSSYCLKFLDMSHNNLNMLTFTSFMRYSPLCAVNVSENPLTPDFRSENMKKFTCDMRNLKNICLQTFAKYLSSNRKYNSNLIMQKLVSLSSKSGSMLTIVENMMTVCSECRKVSLLCYIVDKCFPGLDLLTYHYLPNVTYTIPSSYNGRMGCEFRFCSKQCASIFTENFIAQSF